MLMRLFFLFSGLGWLLFPRYDSNWSCGYGSHNCLQENLNVLEGDPWNRQP